MSALRETGNEPTVLDRLRQETASAHQRIEAQVDVFRPGFDVSAYLALLCRLYGFVQPWEEAVFPRLQTFDPHCLAERRKAWRLAADLAYLGLDPTLIPRCSNLPTPTTAPQAMGSLYVLEGATLGGQILSRHLRSTLQLDPAALNYFSGYGDQTGAMWKSFREAVLLHTTPETEPEIVASAIRTFAALNAWLEGAPAQ